MGIPAVKKIPRIGTSWSSAIAAARHQSVRHVLHGVSVYPTHHAEIFKNSDAVRRQVRNQFRRSHGRPISLMSPPSNQPFRTKALRGRSGDLTRTTTMLTSIAIQTMFPATPTQKYLVFKECLLDSFACHDSFAVPAALIAHRASVMGRLAFHLCRSYVSFGCIDKPTSGCKNISAVPPIFVPGVKRFLFMYLACSITEIHVV